MRVRVVFTLCALWFFGASSPATPLGEPLDINNVCSVLFALRAPASQLSGINDRLARMLNSIGTVGNLLTFSVASLRSDFRITQPKLLVLTEALTQAGFRLPDSPPTVDVLLLAPN